MKKIREWWSESWHGVLFLLAGLTAFAGLYGYKLGSLVAGNSIFEQPGFLGITSKSTIIQDIAFGPLKVAQAIAVKIDDPNATLLRILSAITVLAGVLALFLVLDRWHTQRVAIIGTLLFATSSYTLHQGRFAGHEVAYLAVVPLILLAGIWLRSKRDVTKLPIALILSALLLYIPGVWLPLLVVAIFFRKRLLLAWKYVGKRSRLIGGVGFGLTVLPIIYSLIRYPSQLPTYLGYDRITESGLGTALRQLADIPDQLLWHGPNEPIKWVTGTPILDIATITFIILGTYSYLRGRHPVRARLLGMLLITGIVLASTSVYVTVAFLLPIAYILATNGIAYLLQSWFTVFPKNPAARSLGIVLVFLLVAVTSFYHLKRYYVAWPNSPATHKVLTTKVQ